MTGTGKTPPPEAVIVGLADRVSDCRGLLVPLGVVAGSDALSPVETDAPFPDCPILPSRAVLVVPGRRAVIGAVASVVSEPLDPDRTSLDPLTDFVAPKIPASIDALALVEIGPDSESSKLDC